MQDRNLAHRTARLCIPRLLVRIDMPHHVIRQSEDAVAGALGHFREAFCFGLVLEGVAGEVDAWVWMSVLAAWEGGMSGREA